MDNTFLISFSGADQPGLISSLAGILDQHAARLLDVGQALVHETVALGILVRSSSLTDTVALESDLRICAERLELHIGFELISPEGFGHWATAQTKDRFVLTLLGREITARQLFCVSTVIAQSGLNIDRIERLSGRLSLVTPAEDSYACLELHVSTGFSALSPAESDALADQMRASLMALTHELTLDIAFQKECVFRRNRRLFVFDMDSTLIAGEVIDELAKLAGVGDRVSAITAAAMRGELDFQQSFRARVALLRGLPEHRAMAVLNSVPLVQGAERLISTLKRLGYKTAILSGGFNFFARDLQARLGVDYVFANDLNIAGGFVTGEVKTPIVDAQRKADLLREIAARENIALGQVVAVGDGANDLPMLNIAGMGIAFHAKPLVREKAGNALSYLGLDSLLYLIGIRDRDLPGLTDVATPVTDILCG